jgi:selenium-binding protein 1
MSSWELDPALFLSSRFQPPAPAEEVACVICANPAIDDQPRLIRIIDVNPTSRSYSDTVGEIAIGRGDVRPCVSGAPEPGRWQQIAPRVLLVHDPACTYGFVSSGFGLHDLSSAVSIWHRGDDPATPGPWAPRQVIAIADEPACAEQLPTLLRQSGAVPALITDMALSADDHFLYVACWGSGSLRQFDVSNPLQPREIASVQIGGIVTRTAHPSQARRLNGGPASVTVSRDGRRVYLTNALSQSWNSALYPDGLQGWMVKLDADSCGMSVDPNFFVDFGDLCPLRVCLPDQAWE